jgi:hypothetical protein
VGFWILILWDDKIEEYFWILKSMSVDRLVPGLSFKQNARFLEFVGPREKLEAPSDKEVYEGWDTLTPKKNYGKISLRSFLKSFETPLKEALTQGTGDDFIKAFFEEGSLEQVYVALANPNDLDLEDSDKKIIENHSDDAVKQQRANLNRFKADLDGFGMPGVYTDFYREKLESQLRFLDRIPSLGKPELTVQQYEADEWFKKIDLEASRTEGQVVFKFEQIARDFLLAARDMKRPEVTVAQALENWQLSDEEWAYVNPGFDKGEDLDSGGDKNIKSINSEVGTRLVKVLLNRLNLLSVGVEVVKNKTSILFVPRAGEAGVIQYPRDRELTGEEVPYNAGHEKSHAVVTNNAGKQGCTLLRIGSTEDYLEAYEGIAMVVEAVLGQPFGHVRQQEFAARYLAAAMAMKAHEVNGEVVADYSTQQIYDDLRELGVGEKIAQTTVMRVIRGTSLRREGMYLELPGENGIEKFPVSEAYIKDMVYFAGRMNVLDWVRRTIPVPEGARTSLTTEAREFSPRTLARIGLGRYEIDAEKAQGVDEVRNKKGIRGFEDLRESYGKLVNVGKETLFEMLNYLMVAKLDLDDLVNPESKWAPYLKREGEEMIDFARILKPASVDALLKLENT